jgi:hypothetical protein
MTHPTEPQHVEGRRLPAHQGHGSLIPVSPINYRLQDDDKDDDEIDLREYGV